MGIFLRRCTAPAALTRHPRAVVVYTLLVLYIGTSTPQASSKTTPQTLEPAISRGLVPQGRLLTTCGRGEYVQAASCKDCPKGRHQSWSSHNFNSCDGCWPVSARCCCRVQVAFDKSRVQEEAVPLARLVPGHLCTPRLNQLAWLIFP